MPVPPPTPRGPLAREHAALLVRSLRRRVRWLNAHPASCYIVDEVYLIGDWVDARRTTLRSLDVAAELVPRFKDADVQAMAESWQRVAQGREAEVVRNGATRLRPRFSRLWNREAYDRDRLALDDLWLALADVAPQVRVGKLMDIGLPGVDHPCERLFGQRAIKPDPIGETAFLRLPVAEAWARLRQEGPVDGRFAAWRREQKRMRGDGTAITRP